jgi:hypothetical protein
MNIGVMVLGFDSEIPSSRRVTEECAAKLRERGHSNVTSAYYRGRPSEMEAVDLLTSLKADPIIVLPLVVSEGELSVHLMPKAMGMPDNCCSYTRDSQGREVAVRFSTSFNWNTKVTELLEKRIRAAGGRPGTGVLLLHYGSRMRYPVKDSAKHAERLREAGYIVEEAALSDLRSIRERWSKLRSEASEIVGAPLMRSWSERSDRTLKEAVGDPGIAIAEPLGSDDLVIDILESKIPELK